MSVKKGQKVKFTSRTRSGTGVVVSIRGTQKGDFYTVKIDGDENGKQLCFRASQLSPA